MDKSSESASLCRAVLSHINARAAKKREAMLEAMDVRAGGLLMRPETTAVRAREYVDGSYIGQFDFSLTIRLRARSTAERIAAIDELFEAGEYLENAELPRLGAAKSAEAFEMLSTPRLTQRADDGSEDYTAVYRLRYTAAEKRR